MNKYQYGVVLACVSLFFGCDKAKDSGCQGKRVDSNTCESNGEVGCHLAHIAVSNVWLKEDSGGYVTDNRFGCSVSANEDCVLWLEVCDSRDGHRFSAIKDARTERKFCATPKGANSLYDVEITVDGDGESVASVVTLCGKPVKQGEASVLFQTNAVLGTWKGR